MKLCDVHAHVGHWPFRRLPFIDAASLLREMDRLGILRAAVCNSHGVFYNNPQASNEELFRELEGKRDRLLPVVTLDPGYVRAAADLRSCRERDGAAALRLVPQYSGTPLSDKRSLELAGQAAAMGMHVLVPRIMVDPRQRHRLDVEATVELDALAAFARALPGATVIGVEYPLSAAPATVELLRAVPNLVFEISRVPLLNGRVVPALLGALGASRLLLGTGMPFKTPEVSLLKLELLGDDEGREDIGSRCFDKLFA